MFDSEAERNEAFVRLHSRYQQRIYAFILTLVPNPTDAEDVLQETGVVLWRKFDDFDLNTDFVRWAHQIAYYEVLKFRGKRGKERLHFDETLIKAIADTTSDMAESLQLQQSALENCLNQLAASDRELVAQRFRRNVTTKQLASELGRPVGGVYKSLQRITKALLKCVRQHMAREVE